MSQASELQLPGWLSTTVRATPAAEVDGQGVPVARDWWQARLDGTPFAGELFDSLDGRLTRTELFGLGERAGESPENARRLLWAALAWGTGRRHRNNGARITAMESGGDELSEVLRRAAETGRTDPSAAYGLFRPDRNAVSYLGPPFFTKFLYFAGGGSAAHPCLILDSLVAKTLRQESGWTELTGWYRWSAGQYVDYCELLTRWARELSEDGSGEVVRPDQLEYALFNRGRHS